MTPDQVAAVLLSERPERDGQRWADGARDEWSTIVLAFDRAFSAAAKARGESWDFGAFFRACGYRS